MGFQGIGVANLCPDLIQIEPPVFFHKGWPTAEEGKRPLVLVVLHRDGGDVQGVVVQAMNVD